MVCNVLQLGVNLKHMIEVLFLAGNVLAAYPQALVALPTSRGVSPAGAAVEGGL